MKKTSYRALSTELDWAIFSADCMMTDIERALIQPLTQSAACDFWHQHISANPLARHPMLLTFETNLSSLSYGPDWQDQPLALLGLDEESNLLRFLRDNFKLAAETRLYFVMMQEVIYYLPFSLGNPPIFNKN